MQTLSREAKTNVSIIVSDLFNNINNIENYSRQKIFLLVLKMISCTNSNKSQPSYNHSKTQQNQQNIYPLIQTKNIENNLLLKDPNRKINPNYWHQR